MKLWKMGLLSLAASILLSGCGNLGWTTADDYDPKHYKVGADGVSTVAPKLLNEWADKNLSHLGRPTTDELASDELVDDFGDTYKLKTTTLYREYENVSREGFQSIKKFDKEYDLLLDCGPMDESTEDLMVLEERYEEMCSLTANEGPMSIYGYWTKFESGEVETFFSLTYDPRYEGRSLFGK